LVEPDDGRDWVQQRLRSGTRSDRSFEKEVAARNLREAKDIAKAYADASPEEKKEMEADYIGRVERATKNSQGSRIWHLLRIKEMKRETVMKAMEIVAKEEEDIVDIIPVVAGYICGELDEAIGLKGIQLLGEYGRVTNLGYYMWEVKSDSVRRKIEEAIIVGIGVLVRNKDKYVAEFYYSAEEEIAALIKTCDVSDEVRNAARNAISKIRKERKDAYIEKVQTAVDNHDLLGVYDLLRYGGYSDETIMKAMEIVAKSHHIEEVSMFIDEFIGEDVVSSDDGVSEAIIMRGIQLMGKHGQAIELACYMEKGEKIDYVRDQVETAIIEAIDVVAKGCLTEREKNLEVLVRWNRLSDKVRKAAEAALEKCKNPLQGDGASFKTSKDLKKKGKSTGPKGKAQGPKKEQMR